MRFLPTLVLPGLLALANGAAIAREESSPELYDAVIVGGGPSGLSALSGLARVRRKVLLIDSGEYRNGPTRHMHDVLGFDGVTPAYYRWAARKQISYYDTVSATNGTVSNIEPKENYTRFETTYSHNGKKKTVASRKIVLATGLKDIIPNTPGLLENWGKGIYWCPWCDGHEHEDQPLGLLGSLDKIAGMVLEILTLNTNLIAFVNGTDTEEVRVLAENETTDYATYLKIHNVKVDNRTITGIKRLKNGSDPDANPSLPTVAEHDEFSVEFAEGADVKRAAFFTSFSSTQRSDLGEELGVKLVNKGKLDSDQVKGLLTNVPGVYAVGDANNDNATNVPHALFSGKRAAVFLHVKLEREQAAEEIAAAKQNGTNIDEKREVDLDDAALLPRDDEIRSLWSRMNEDPRDILYAGEFDQ